MTAEQFQHRFLPLHRQLFQQALALLGSTAEAEDAVQETYLRVWQQADRVSRMERPEGFFVQTLRNICLNMIRGRRQTAGLESLADSEAEDWEPAASGDHQLLRQAIGQLPPKARSMVTMHSQLTTQQIAELTGETNANVRSTLSRARALLRQLLTEKKGETER